MSFISPTYTGQLYGTDSTSSTTESDETSAGLGQDAFLKMFLAQVTNQDPLNPMDNTEFTAQLATFSQLEQLTQIAESMEGIGRMEAAIERNTVLSYIGRDVTIAGNKVPVTNGSTGSISYTMEKTGDVRVIITNDKGVTVATEELGFLTEGRHTYVWKGTDMWGEVVDDGTYKVTFAAYDHDTGESIKVSDLMVTARATGYEMDEDGNQYVLLGSAAVDVSKILGVQAPLTTDTEEEESTAEAAASAVASVVDAII
jgi:flagellar basal-body rod modification protein FlgD